MIVSDMKLPGSDSESVPGEQSHFNITAKSSYISIIYKYVSLHSIGARGDGSKRKSSRTRERLCKCSYAGGCGIDESGFCSPHHKLSEGVTGEFFEGVSCASVFDNFKHIYSPFYLRFQSITAQPPVTFSILTSRPDVASLPLSLFRKIPLLSPSVVQCLLLLRIL